MTCMAGPQSTSAEACGQGSGVAAISQTEGIKHEKVKCLAAGHAAQLWHGWAQTSEAWLPCPFS